MSVSQKSKNMKKSSKRSKNIRNNKKTKRNLKKMKGGMRLRDLKVGTVYKFTKNKVNALYPNGPKGDVVYVPMEHNEYLQEIGHARDDVLLEFKNTKTNEIFQIDVDFFEDIFELQQK